MKTEKRPPKSGKPVVVIEIGNEWLKLLQAEPGRGGTFVSKVHLERIDEAGESLPHAIKEAVEKSKFADVPVIACLPRQAVNIRLLDLPSTDPKEIADMVDLQVGKQTPYSKDEIVFDYKIIRSGREGYARVLLVIAQRSVVRQRFLSLEEAGLRVDKMSVSSEGLLGWYHRVQRSGEPEAEGTAIILDVDSSYSDFAVVSGGDLVFSRSILIGGSQLLKEPAQWMDRYGQEIQRALEVFRSESSSRKIDKLLLAGAGPNVPDLASTLRDLLDLEVTAVDSFNKVERAELMPGLDDPRSRGLSLTPLVGSALAPLDLSLDLTPDAVKMRKALEKSARNLTWFGIEVMLVLTLLTVLIADRYYRRDAYLSRLREIGEQTDREADEIEKMRLKTRLIAGRLDRKSAPLELLREIQSLTPDAIYLTSVQVDENRQVVLRGSAEAVSDVLKFVHALEASPRFENVKSTSSRKDFEVVCALEK